MELRFKDQRLEAIKEKLDASQRLSHEDGRVLFETRDVLGIGRLANRERRRRHGDQAFFIYNFHLNYTNVCVNQCLFCAYGRQQGDDQAFTLSLENIRNRLMTHADEPIRELHIVGGLHPDLGLDYYLNLLATAREVFPNATIKAFTAVEIDYLSGVSGLSLDQTLARLKAAGLSMLPGGGAEVLCQRIHDKLYPKKISPDRWLEVMQAVHRAGITSNATLLYGHVETVDERIAHLIRLRQLQDRTGGFSAFIPLAFHPKNTRLSHLHGPTGLDDLKTIAVSRLMLDNFDHIKAYWIMLGEKLAQVALHFGADDLDGTVIEEKITHMAGGTSPEGLTRDKMKRLIREAGFRPVERDSFYQPVSGPLTDANHSNRKIPGIQARHHRVEAKDALELLINGDFHQLANWAHEVRCGMHPEPVVTFVKDRNINYTNICVSGCKFCAYFRPPGSADGFVISRDELAQKIRETLDLGGTQILLQGGMNPDLDLDYYLDLLQFITDNFPIHVHGFSPPEIAFLSKKTGISIKETIQALKSAGLGSIPGGGAEILVDQVRETVSPHKCSADTWLEVMETAHHLGLRTTATMMFGHGETAQDIIQHLMRIRQLQDRTGGFTAFIPWTFQPTNTQISVEPATAVAYLRVLAVSRIVLDNVPNIQASWVTQGDKIAQTALFFGANDFGSTMIEENVVAAAGVHYRLPESEIVHLIRDAGFIPVQRDCFYQHLKTFESP